jgi:pimeloyl-ACP methyl ester carboxylesterase
MTASLDRQIRLSCGPVHYRKHGDGRAILHLHSAAGPRLSPAIERLAQRHTIHAPTVPGFDGTPSYPSVASMTDLADLMAEFTRSVLGAACDMIGESFGGWVALWLAVRHPDLVDQLVLEAPAGLRSAGIGGLPADPAGRQRSLYAVPERTPKETRSPEVLEANQRALRNYMGGVTLDQDLLAALPRVKARTLVLFGTKDEITPAEEAGRRLKAGIPHSHLSFIYGAAHALEFDQPQRVARLVASFLERGEAFVVRSTDDAA